MYLKSHKPFGIPDFEIIFIALHFMAMALHIQP